MSPEKRFSDVASRLVGATDLTSRAPVMAGTSAGGTKEQQLWSNLGSLKQVCVGGGEQGARVGVQVGTSAKPTTTSVMCSEWKSLWRGEVE
jgi:hypothetical protein